MGGSVSKARDIGATMLAPDTIFVDGDGSSTSKPCIISKSQSPFVQFCLLAEALMGTRDRIVRKYSVATRYGTEQLSDDSSDDSSDDDDGLDYGMMGPRPHTDPLSDPEAGYPVDSGAGVSAPVPVFDMSAMANSASVIADDGSGAVVIETGVPNSERNVRHRSAQSPVRETWSVDLSAATGTADSQRKPLMAAQKRSSAPQRRQSPFGDLMASTVVRLIPYYNTSESNDGVDDGYCRIDRIELWASYRVYMTIHAEDSGLVQAMMSGAIDLHTSSSHVSVNSEHPIDSIAMRVNAWRHAYAESLNTYHTTTDTFMALATAYLTQAAARGDEQAAGLVKLANEANATAALLMPQIGPNAEDAGSHP